MKQLWFPMARKTLEELERLDFRSHQYEALMQQGRSGDG